MAAAEFIPGMGVKIEAAMPSASTLQKIEAATKAQRDLEAAALRRTEYIAAEKQASMAAISSSLASEHRAFRGRPGATLAEIEASTSRAFLRSAVTQPVAEGGEWIGAATRRLTRTGVEDVLGSASTKLERSATVQADASNDFFKHVDRFGKFMAAAEGAVRVAELVTINYREGEGAGLDALKSALESLPFGIGELNKGVFRLKAMWSGTDTYIANMERAAKDTAIDAQNAKERRQYLYKARLGARDEAISAQKAERVSGISATERRLDFASSIPGIRPEARIAMSRDVYQKRIQDLEMSNVRSFIEFDKETKRALKEIENKGGSEASLGEFRGLRADIRKSMLDTIEAERSDIVDQMRFSELGIRKDWALAQAGTLASVNAPGAITGAGASFARESALKSVALSSEAMAILKQIADNTRASSLGSVVS